MVGGVFVGGATVLERVAVCDAVCVVVGKNTERGEAEMYACPRDEVTRAEAVVRVSEGCRELVCGGEGEEADAVRGGEEGVGQVAGSIEESGGVCVDDAGGDGVFHLLLLEEAWVEGASGQGECGRGDEGGQRVSGR